MDYHDAMMTGLDSYWDKDEDAELAYARLARRMNNGDWPHEYLSIFMQHSWQTRFNSYDAYVFGQFEAHRQAGNLLIMAIPLGVTPWPDVATERNNEALAKLPSPLKATFHGGAGDDDGTLSWDTPIETTDATEWLPKQHVPLEVGSTRPATTYMHLYRSLFLARWPYESERLFLLQWKRESWEKHQIPAPKTRPAWWLEPLQATPHLVKPARPTACRAPSSPRQDPHAVLAARIAARAARKRGESRRYRFTIKVEAEEIE